MGGQPDGTQGFGTVDLVITQVIDNDTLNPATILNGNANYTVRSTLTLNGIVGFLLENGAFESTVSMHLEGQGALPNEVDVTLTPNLALVPGGSPYTVDVVIPAGTLTADGNYRLSAFAQFVNAAGAVVPAVVGQDSFAALLGVQV